MVRSLFRGVTVRRVVEAWALAHRRAESLTAFHDCENACGAAVSFEDTYRELKLRLLERELFLAVVRRFKGAP
jgi:hypothetical protein